MYGAGNCSLTVDYDSMTFDTTRIVGERVKLYTGKTGGGDEAGGGGGEREFSETIVHVTVTR